MNSKYLIEEEKIICVKHFCNGNKDCIRKGEVGIIYNMDDYPEFIYADFTEHKGVALSEEEYEKCIRKY